MKFCCLLLLCGFLGIGSGWGQQLRGGYVLADRSGGGVGGDEFYHFSRSRFIYLSLTDTGNSYGSGTFQVKGDSLFLRFDDWQLPPVPDISLDPSFQSDTSRNDVTIRVLDETYDERIPGVLISSESTPNDIVYTNVEGLARLSRIAPHANKLIIKYPYDFYKERHIELDTAKGHHFLIKLRRPPHNSRVAGNTRLSFFIKNSTSHSLLLRDCCIDYAPASPGLTRHFLNEYRELAK